MEEKNNSNNPINIKFTTILFLILVIVVFIIGGTLAMLNKKDDSKSKNEIVKENTIQNNVKQTEVKKSNQKDYSDTDFSFKFLKMENEKENIIYSPLSIKYALQMLKEGANGKTKTQIEKAIENEKITKYNNIKDVLSLANALYIRDTYSSYVKDEYNNKLDSLIKQTRIYLNELEKLPMKNCV